MSDRGVPAWCRWRSGDSPVLVIAPHGGRRDPVPPDAPPAGPNRKVNDLHTADLADELAAALGGGLIVNPSHDRNRLDLNRISQVTRAAPWFLALIETLLEAILARHPCAELLFVHGWNVIQPRCDIGLGHALAGPAAAGACPVPLTVSAGYALGRLARLQSACAAAGIVTTFGERYPARHPNNLLQLFRHAECSPHTPVRLAAWAAAGRIEAVQLELGVPVRWPGRLRSAFIGAARAAFCEPAAHAAHHPPTATAASPQVRRAARGEHAQGSAAAPEARGRAASLQLYDPSADVALTARLDSVDRPSDGRLLIFIGAQRVALFIGEDVHATQPVATGPHFLFESAGFRLYFDGPALTGTDGTLYRDLEQAFAASRLCAVKLDVCFRPTLSDAYGIAEGWVELDGERRALATHGFARHGVLSAPQSSWMSQVVLSAAFGAAGALHLRHEVPGSGELRQLSGDGEALHRVGAMAIGFDGDRYSPTHIAVDGDLVCEPRTRMAIVRPLGHHRRARVTFGAARFTRAGAAGFGFYEYARAID